MDKNAKDIAEEQIDGFEVDELFMSRTDERGVIQSGNSTFRRLSGFDWPELIGAPHKLIRHPDMPRAVFWQFWHALKNGEWFGAYIKNRAKSGRHYWVFAVALPIDGGYLSVRLKPTSPLLQTVGEVYARLRQVEAGGTAPEDAAAMIEDEVRARGFRDYHDFMGYALGAEFSARCLALGEEVDPGVEKFSLVCSMMVELSTEVEGIMKLFAGIKNSPTNLNILGSRLSVGREPMQVVAQNYGILSDELFNSISKLGGGLSERLDTAFMGRTGHCAGLLYEEAIRKYQTEEPNRGTRGHTAEARILLSALRRFVAAAEEGCQQIEREISLFVEQGGRLRRMLSGLAMTRVICRIESASVQEDTSSIDEISTRLTVFQTELGRALDRITTICDKLARNVPHREFQQGLDAIARDLAAAEAACDEEKLSA